MNGQRDQNLHGQLEKLPGQIRGYYGVYFATLRRELARLDLFAEAVPEYLNGFKRILTLGGTYGVVVAHFPAEVEITISENGSGKTLLRFSSKQDAVADSYQFVAPFRLSVNELVNTVSDGEDVDAGTSFEDVPWDRGVAGVFPAPQHAIDSGTGRLVWQAPWTRLAFADYNLPLFLERHGEGWSRGSKRRGPLHPWPGARCVGRDRAPEKIDEAGVKAGDRGVVLEVLEKPARALLVEYADLEGQTKALVTYSADLGTVIDIFVDQGFSEGRENATDRGETTRERSFDLPTDFPVFRGGLVHA